MSGLPEVDAVRSRLLAGVRRLVSEVIPTRESAGRWLAEDVSSDLDLPRWDQSSMDGYAVRSADLPASPSLRVVGRAAAGGEAVGRVGAGEAVRIFTGAPLPDGADSVVMQEDCEPDAGPPATVRVIQAVRPWENVRLRGEDVRKGETILRSGARIGAAQVGLLAACGCETVTVARRPNVALIATGSELRSAGVPLGPSDIYESNTPMLRALVAGTGAAAAARVLPDDLLSLTGALREAAAVNDLIVTVGGASVGEADLCRRAVAGAGGAVDLWRVNLKPGKPFFAGRIGDAVVIGLPGNPVSAFVTAVLFLLPCLRRMQGDPGTFPPRVGVVLGESVRNPDDRPHYVRMRRDPEGRAWLAGGQGSHRIAGLAAADCLLEVAPRSEVPGGTFAAALTWTD